MPTSPISKPSPAKKNLPIKWRDSAWSPRIAIRSLNRRRPPQGLWESDTRISDWNSGPEKIPYSGTPRWGRAGGRRPLSDSTLPLNPGPSRFLPTPRLNNLF
jgi:hypothetical protein